MKDWKTVKRICFLILIIWLPMLAGAQTLRGKVTDKATKEPLIGAKVQIEGLEGGTVTDIDGAFSLKLEKGTYTLKITYTGFADFVRDSINVTADAELNVEMETDATTLEEISVAARKNLEGERALLNERRNASVAIENIGAKEMSAKGIGNVEEGVKKITGVSIADAGQIIVRGLGDRYSTTTLNGLPIASPNPDNKLIPLDLFPSNTVQHITVNKNYEADAFADYSGAHIDINTKEHVSDDFFNVGFNVGGKFNTLGKSFYQMDREHTLFRNPGMDDAALNMTLTKFDEYVLTKDIFNTSFNVDKKSSLPDFGGSAGFGHRYNLWGQKLSVLAAGNVSNGWQIMEDCVYKTLEATGNVQNDFEYDSYTQSLNLAALCCVGYTLRKYDRIGYTFFYARNATDNYKLREGVDAEGYELTGSNNVTHIYTLANHQLSGLHFIDDNQEWEVEWDASYGKTSSDEPDRRQVMYVTNSKGNLNFFKLNSQETMRYYGELDEKEWNAKLALKWNWREGDYVRVGFNYKDKDRDYIGTRFYYDVNSITDEVDDIYNPDEYLNQSNVSDGVISIDRKKQPKDTYDAGNNIYAAYATTDLHIKSNLLMTVGLRYEYSKQWVNYSTDGGTAQRRDLNGGDLFPSLNFKYDVTQADILRLSASRTVTRPQFIEMAPFLYQESYGAAQIRGNADLDNGYNYNVDLRYEHYTERGDLFSVTGYFKFLDSPIERVQELSGGATEHTFQNADNGIAAGVEGEVKANLIDNLRLSANVSYMYTDVKLPEGGAYTNKDRALQGASPILANADLTYTYNIKDEQSLDAALVYNLQGRRIHSVGVSGLGDVKQQTVNTLNLNVSYTFNRHFSVKLLVKDLLNRAVVFKQEVPDTGEEVEVERYKKGTAFEVGFEYKL